MSGIIRKMKRLHQRAMLKKLKKYTRQTRTRAWHCCHGCGQMFTLPVSYPPTAAKYCDKCYVKIELGWDDE